MDALYLSYDGVLEPIGRSQILPYLYSLSEHGVRLELLTFEKSENLANSSRVAELQQLLDEHGIRWTSLHYHKRPKVLSTLLDIIVGLTIALFHAPTAKYRIVHARSYVPALMAVPLKWLTGARFIFDMRGFWPEERVEMGVFSPEGLFYRIAKRCEKHFLSKADRIVVLTRRAKEVLQALPLLRHRSTPIDVIPCCVNLRFFEAREANVALANRHGLTGKFVVGNIGAINKRYLLPQMFRFAARLKQRRPGLCFVYLTQQDPSPLFDIARAEGLADEDLVVARATPEEVPIWLSLFQFSVFFLKPGYAAQASCYTKLGELLAAGVPVVTNAGVGDIEDIIEEGKVGVILHGLSDSDISVAATRVAFSMPATSQLKEACRSVAAKNFDLELGCKKYDIIYQSLLKDSHKSRRSLHKNITQEEDCIKGSDFHTKCSQASNRPTLGGSSPTSSGESANEVGK